MAACVRKIQLGVYSVEGFAWKVQSGIRQVLRPVYTSDISSMIAVNYLPTQIARGDYRASSRRKLEHALVQLHGNFWLGKKKVPFPPPLLRKLRLRLESTSTKKYKIINWKVEEEDTCLLAKTLTKTEYHFSPCRTENLKSHCKCCQCNGPLARFGDEICRQILKN